MLPRDLRPFGQRHRSEDHMKKFVAETRVGNDWENVWTDHKERPLEFLSRKAAQEEIDDLILDTSVAFEKGYMSAPYSRDDYRIVEIV